MARRRVVGFHTDEAGDWVAELACGHGQHLRHRPPFQNRPVMMTAEGRAGLIGRELECLLCEDGLGDECGA